MFDTRACLRLIAATLLALGVACVAAPNAPAQDSSVAIRAEDSISVSSRERFIVPVLSRNLMKSEVAGVRLVVTVAGRDVTSHVLRVHHVGFNRLGKRARTGSRLDIFELEFDSWLLRMGAPIHLEASTLLTTGRIRADAVVTVRMEEAESDECIEECVQDFIDELGISKDDTTEKVTLGNGVAGGLKGAAIRSAVVELRNCLKMCDEDLKELSDTFDLTDSDGDPISVKLDLESTGQDAYANSGSADISIAIGGDGGDGSNTAGGSATATNTSAGGASLAIGGNGGNNQSGNAGNGGEATADSTPAGAPTGGDSYGVGGTGGDGSNSGGNGGDGSGTTDCPAGTAYGQGGDGGDPHNNAATGGVGGSGTAENGNGQGSVTALGAPNSVHPVGPGQHGGGGTYNVTGGTPGGNGSGNGQAITNT